jgi:hypothetical protein
MDAYGLSIAMMNAQRMGQNPRKYTEIDRFALACTGSTLLMFFSTDDTQ